MKKSITNSILVVLVLIYILFEELVWNTFAKPLINYITDLKLLKKAKIYLHKIDRRFILLGFLLLFVVAELIGIYAGVMFVSGHFITGALLYALKIPLVSLAFWLFNATKDRLLKFDWFKKSYYFIIGVMDKIKHSEAYEFVTTNAKRIKALVKEKFISDKSSIKKKISRIYNILKKAINRS